MCVCVCVCVCVRASIETALEICTFVTPQNIFQLKFCQKGTIDEKSSKKNSNLKNHILKSNKKYSQIVYLTPEVHAQQFLGRFVQDISGGGEILSTYIKQRLQPGHGLCLLGFSVGGLYYFWGYFIVIWFIVCAEVEMCVWKLHLKCVC